MEKNFNRAVILGCACVITSRLTVEQLENFRRYHPEALKMWDEDKKETFFSVDLDDGPGSIFSDKAVYSRTKTPDGRATITVVLDPEIEDKSVVVREKLGKALLNLEEMEDHLLSMVDSLREEVGKMDGMIITA